MATAEPTLVIYGSGDPGMAELKDLLFTMKIPIDYRDIRDGVDGMKHLKELVSRGLNTVPQTFLANPDGSLSLVGDFEATLAYLDDRGGSVAAA